MSHPQAFHTSCRRGLAGQAGFQFNAASPSLDAAVLNQLAAAHASYHVPRDMPLEPTSADLTRFPIALKVAPVDRVGAVVSRTIYVGREFRGRDDAPDEGRFGNYFSHIVVGNGDEPFDGLLGIELWEAPHWTDVESAEPELSELDRLQPGPLDVERVASILSAVPGGVAAAVLDAAAAALDGGPRVVLVDADSARAAAWIAWISYALPVAQAQRLTFTTFDGRPRYADDVHVCVTTPACDTAFAAHELARSVRLLDVNETPSARPSLYARVAVALAEAPDALATAVRAIPADAGGARRGAWLAVYGGRTELVEGDELPAVIDLLRELTTEHGQVARAAATAKELPADTAIDRATLSEWAALHHAARERPPDEDSRNLAATALARIVPFAGELPDEVAPVAPDAPTQPPVGNLVPWLSAVEAAAGAVAGGPLIRDGLRLGLVGVNAAVDRRLASALSVGLAHASVWEMLWTIGKRPALEHIVTAVTEELADRAFVDDEARRLLREVGQLRVARATLQRRSEEQRSFERLAAWLRSEVDEDPSRRPSAACELAALAATDRDHAEIRELWGPRGPCDQRGNVDLLNAYLDCGVQPPLSDGLRALDELMKHPLTNASVTEVLRATIARDERLRRRPACIAWWVVLTQPGTDCRFAEWASQAIIALAADEPEIPDARRQEMRHVICRQVVHQRFADDYAQGIRTLRSTQPQYLDDGLVDELTKRFRDGQGNARLMADLFESWRRIPGDGSTLVDGVLQRAAAASKRRDIDEVDEHLPQWLLEDWKSWLARRPRTSVARALGRFGRRPKDGTPKA